LPSPSKNFGPHPTKTKLELLKKSKRIWFILGDRLVETFKYIDFIKVDGNELKWGLDMVGINKYWYET